MGLRATRTSWPVVAGVIAGGALALLQAVAAPASASGGEIRVTAVAGGASAGGEALGIHAEVSAGESIETGEQGRCSVLLGDAAILQFCNRAAVRVGTPGASDTSVVKLDQGELKATVGPRAAGDPLEIHTPAAIATLLGTVVHVEVDAETGDTIVSSLESRVRVKSSNPLARGSVVLEAGEQVTIRRGEPPERKRRFDPGRFTSAGSCTFDDDFHRAAIRAERAARVREVMDAIALDDVPVGGLPAVAASFAGPVPVTSSAVPTEDWTQARPVCLPGLCGEPLPSPAPLRSGVSPPDLCPPGLPGEHCLF